MVSVARSPAPVDSQKRFDLLLVFHDDAATVALARAVRAAVERSAAERRMFPSIFSMDEDLVACRDVLIDAVLQTRGGGVVVFILSRDFFRNKLCLAAIFSALKLQGSANPAEQFTLLFMCPEAAVESIQRDPFVRDVVPQLQACVIVPIPSGTVETSANHIADVVSSTWNNDSTGGLPTALGCDLYDSFKNLLSIFTLDDLPFLCAEFNIVLQNVQDIASVYSAVVKDSRFNLRDIKPLRKAVIRCSGPSSLPKLRMLDAFALKWAKCESYSWGADARDSLLKEINTADMRIRSQKTTDTEVVERALRATTTSIEATVNALAMLKGHTSKYELCRRVFFGLTAVQRGLDQGLTSNKLTHTEWSRLLRKLTIVFERITNDVSRGANSRGWFPFPGLGQDLDKLADALHLSLELVTDIQQDLDSMGFFSDDANFVFRSQQQPSDPFAGRIQNLEFQLATALDSITALEAVARSAPISVQGVTDAIKECVENSKLAPTISAPSETGVTSGNATSSNNSPAAFDTEIASQVDLQHLAPRIDELDVTLREYVVKLQKSGLSEEEKDTILLMLDGAWRMWQLDPSKISFARRPTGDRIEIGDGGFGRVYKAAMPVCDTKGNVERVAPVAVKVLYKSVLREGLKADFLREALLLQEAAHPCVVKFFGAYWPSEDVMKQSAISAAPGRFSASELSDDYGDADWEVSSCMSAVLVSELMSCNLAAAQEEGLLSSNLSKSRVLSDVAAGLEFLHSKGIVHKDIKAENVLLRVVGDGVVGRAKLADFGVSRRVRKTASESPHAVTHGGGGTWTYMAPELFRDSAVARTPVDVWSFGALIADLACEGRSPLTTMSLVDLTRAALGKRLERMVQGWANGIGHPELRDIAVWCLTADPKKRPAMGAVLKRLEKVIEIEEKRLTWEGFTVSEMFEQALAYYKGSEGTERNYEEAIWWFNKAADLGHYDSLIHLALCFESGHGVERDLEKFFELYCRAAEAGTPLALYNLGVCHAEGKGTAVSLSEAAKLYERAADAGNANAQNNLGCMYRAGEGVEKDAAKAVDLFHRAAESCCPDAQFNLGVCYAEGDGVEKDLKKAGSLYQRAADSGNANAAEYLSLCAEAGLEFNSKPVEAVAPIDMYRCEADAGDPSALYNLGVCYAEGNGVEVDLKKSVTFFLRAVEGGSLDAQNLLGFCYEHGRGVEQDVSRAVELYERAAEADDANATFNLGVCYEEGKGVTRDNAKAVSHFHHAVDSGHLEAMAKLAACYAKGKGVRKDFNMTVQLCEQATEEGSTTAAATLGWCFEHGHGVEKNLAKAVDLYQYSANAGHSEGQMHLASCYENGKGVEEDRTEATYFYKLAAAEGNSSAMRRLKYLQRKGSKREKSTIFRFGKR